MDYLIYEQLPPDNQYKWRGIWIQDEYPKEIVEAASKGECCLMLLQLGMPPMTFVLRKL